MIFGLQKKIEMNDTCCTVCKCDSVDIRCCTICKGLICDTCYSFREVDLECDEEIRIGCEECERCEKIICRKCALTNMFHVHMGCNLLMNTTKIGYDCKCYRGTGYSPPHLLCKECWKHKYVDPKRSNDPYISDEIKDEHFRLATKEHLKQKEMDLENFMVNVL